MRFSEKQTKRAVSLLLCLALLVSMLAFALTVRAEEADELADTGADTYYLWGESTNSPNFSGSTPTGTFSYDSSKGYYYYDLSGSSGDYCFVVSTVSNSASRAVTTPAVQNVASSGSYYLQKGNYHGFNCMHLWNPGGDAVRIYFTSASAGLNAIKAGSDDSQPTQAPTQKPTQAPTTVQPTTVQPTSGGTTPTTPQPTQPGGDDSKTYVYCENEAGWDSVYAYMWIESPKSENAAWPGKAMTKYKGNIWRYEVTSSKWNMIIFSNNGLSQTSNLEFPGKNAMWNNKTNTWGVYDTSPLQISSFSTDVESPQYNGVGVTLSAEAEGQGTVYYKFSVTNSSGAVTVLKDFDTSNSVQWIPQVVGTYTLTFDFRDDAGNTNRRTKSYVIEDGLSSVAPYIKTVTPSGGEIRNNKAVNMSVTAGGGFTGTNLLFYKFTVRNASGTVVNTPYYTLNKNYSFTPNTLGAYSVTVNVQGSDNKTIERTYNFTSVGSVSPTEPPVNPPTEPIVQPTQAPTQAATQAPTQAATQAPTQRPTQAPTQPGQAVLYGDADDDGDVNIVDVTYIQRYEAGLYLAAPLNEKNADVDADDEVSIIDATLVQRYIAGIITIFPAEL